MYEGDTPNAERRAAALALDRDLLRELLGQEELRDLIDPEALEEVEAQLQHRTEAGRAGDRDALQQVLRNVGDLSAEECAERVTEGYSAASMLEKLVAERRVAAVRIAGEERYIAAEDAGMYRDALGVPPPPGLPETFLDSERGPAAHPAAPLRPHPRPLPHRAARRAATGSTRRPPCASSSARASSSAASCCPAAASASGATRTSCAACGGRASPTCAARSKPPRASASPASCPSWQNVDAHRAAGAGPDRLREALVPLQGVALTPKVWEQDVLPRRLGAYSPAWLDELCTSGEVVWIGAGARGRNDGRVALYFREDVRLAGPPPANVKLERAEGEAHDAIRERLAAGPGLLARPARRPRPARRGAPQRPLGPRLVGRGDQRRLLAAARAAPARGLHAGARGTPVRPPPRGAAGAAVQGRWSLVAPLFENAPAAGPKLRAQAELMLERYGIVTRETVLAEGIPGGFSTLYAELGNLELLGTARRGYFVEGLGGAQFALPGAVERLRSLPEGDGSYQLLAATDPANPYGASLPWPKREGGRRPSRAPGAHVLLRDGEPVALRRARRPRHPPPRRARRRAELEAAMRALADAVAAGRLPKLAVEKARRRAGDRLPPRGGAARRGLQPRGPRKLTASA